MKTSIYRARIIVLENKVLITFLLFWLIARTSRAQETPSPISVNFQVDLGSIKTKLPVGLRGNILPLSWDKSYPLKDENGDNIYESNLFLQAEKGAEILEYKFVYGDDPITWELDGSNRLVVLKSYNISLPLAQWNIPDPFKIEQLPLIKSNQLLEDFRIAKRALLTLHPGIYRYNSKEQVEKLFNEYEQRMQEAMTYQEIYLLYSAMLAQFKCGHTYPNFFNQSGFIQEVVFNQVDKLPFLFRIVEDKMIITYDLSDSSRLSGKPEVLSINGIETSEILTTLRGYIKADGSNEAKRQADLNLFGIGAYEPFDIYFPLIYPPQNGGYSLEITDNFGNRAQTIELECISRSERTVRMQNCENSLPAKSDDLWNFEFWEDGTAYLQLGTFDVFQLSFEWKDFMDDAFKKIKKRKSTNLVLDLRWNEGGQDEVLFYLGKMLVKVPIVPQQREEYVRYTQVPNDLRPYLSTWTEEVFDFTDRTGKDENGLYRITPSDQLMIKPFAKGYKGNVYLLVNAANSSSTFYLAEIAKENGLATLVGETTGGSQKGLNGGQMFFVRLPNSKIEFDIPIIGTYSPDKPDAGIKPDILVAETVQSIRQGNDPVIEEVKRRIKK